MEDDRPGPEPGDAGPDDPAVAGAPPPDRSDEWQGWKPVIAIVAVLGALPVIVLAIAYLAHVL